MKCNKCSQTPNQAAARGAFLKRTNAKGVPGIFECSPTCEHLHGDHNDAVIAAITNDDEDEVWGDGPDIQPSWPLSEEWQSVLDKLS